MKRETSPLALLGAVVLAVGCGGGGGGGHTVAPGPSGAMTKAQAIVLARALNLRPEDVPGFGASVPERESSRDRQVAGELAACAGGVGKSHQLAQASSDNFKRGGGLVQVSSGVAVMQTPALAEQDLRALRSARGKSCLARILGSYFNGRQQQGATFGAPTISTGTPPAPGTAGGIALRVTLPVTAHGVTIPAYFDLLGFVYGRAEVSLIAVGIPTAFPAQTEQQLFTLLVHRAIARGA
jgi:hypothetical protein